MPVKKSVKISIITVCYNEYQKIEKTIKSVVNQNYRNIEYIIIDGGSTDGTLDIVRLYEKEDARIRVICEEDSGIYNAMNKGIAMATGAYINFMNAGDSFANTEVIGKMAEILNKKLPDVLCGRAYVFEKGSKRARISAKKGIYRKTIWDVAKGDWAYHQAVFAKTEIIRQYYFNEKYKIAADYDWFVRNMKDKRKICFSDTIVCNYMRDGLSCKRENRPTLEQEKDDIFRRHYGIKGVAIRKIIKLLQ